MTLSMSIPARLNAKISDGVCCLPGDYSALSDSCDDASSSSSFFRRERIAPGFRPKSAARSLILAVIIVYFYKTRPASVVGSVETTTTTLPTDKTETWRHLESLRSLQPVTEASTQPPFWDILPRMSKKMIRPRKRRRRI